MINRLTNSAARCVLPAVLFLFIQTGFAQFNPPALDTVFVDASCEAAFSTMPGPVFTSDSTGFTFEFDEDLTGFMPGDPIPAGTTVEIFYVVEYPLGSSDTFSYEIVYADNTPPTFDNIPNDTLLTCFETVPPPFPVTASDDCDPDVEVTLQENTTQTTDGTCTDTDYLLTRIWTATDDSGNAVIDSQEITVTNLLKPAFITPADTTISCEFTDPTFAGDVSPADITACGTPTVTFADVNTVLSCDNNFLIERIWTVSDGCRDSVSVQMITVIDTIPPTFDSDVMIDTTVNCDLGLNIDQVGMPFNLQDNCSAASEITVDKTDFLLGNICADSYIVERRWYVTDACGNTDSLVFNLIVADTIPPVITASAQPQSFTCATNFEIDNAFNAWIMNNGGATASDNCADDVFWNAYNSGTSDLANLPAANCPSAQNGVYRQQSVDFVVTDNCGNQDTTTAVFTAVDTEAPVLSGCPTDTTLFAGVNDCTADLMLTPPIISEGCGSSGGSESHQTTLIIFGQPGPPEDTPVQSQTINFGVSPPPAFASGNATFSVFLGNTDGEEPTEFFNIIAEDGSIVGQTNPTDMQCGESTTNLTFTPDQINAWAADGQITLILEPNVPAGMPGRFSVNPICSGVSFTTVNLDYPITVPNSLVYEYSINGSARINPGGITNVNETFFEGENEVKYFATDCAGNQDSCTFTVMVNDTVPPTFDCPSDVTVVLPQDSCTADFTLPFPQNINDNCGVGAEVMLIAAPDSADSLLTFAADPNLGDFLAEDKIFTVSQTGANVIGNVTLTVTLQADTSGTGAFYTIVDEDGNDLFDLAGTDCNTANAVDFTLTAAQYMTWASDGTVTFTAVSNTDISVPPGGPGDGINPCDATVVQNDGDTDGTSFMTLSVTYNAVTPVYYTEGATQIDPTPMPGPDYMPTETFAAGETEIFYIITDVNNNADTCSYLLNVQDNQPPTAICEPSFVNINPSGAVIDTIFPAEIDLGSFDNCTIDTVFVTPNIVTCNSDTLNVTLTVIDAAGNQATCQTFIGITNDAPQPTYTVDCDNSTLNLFANPPVGGGGVTYTYEWNGPNNFLSFAQNPVIQETDGTDAGFYTVEITGITGCTAEAVIEVLQSALPPATPDFFVVDDMVCSSENIVLTASNPAGNGQVEYLWYQQDSGGDILLTTTTSPFYSFAAPTVGGTYCYYVITMRNNCFSQASITRCVEVTESPTAVFAETNITVCEGDDFVLEAVFPLPGPGVTFEFIGPGGSQNNSEFQFEIEDPTTNDAGTYLLTAYTNGCQSNTVTASVFINEVPDQPEITSDSPVCLGDTLTLITNVQDAATYIWTSPDFIEFSTDEPALVLPNADNTYAGNWRVRVVTEQNCSSVNSAFTGVTVNPLPVVAAANVNNSTCANEDLELTANEIANAAYTWTGPNFAAGGRTVSAPPVAGTYTVTVIDQNGCTASDDIAITLQNAPSILGVAADDNDCPTGPEDVTLKALLTNNNQDYSFAWSGPGFTSADSCAVIENATTANNGTYQVIVTGQNGCADTSFVQVTMGEIVGTPQAPATDEDMLCAGDALTLTTEANLPGTDVIWYWITPTGTIPTTAASLVINPVSTANTGEYMVYAQVGDCFSDTSGVLLLTVNPQPVTTADCLNCPVCEGDDIMLAADCGIAGATYEWTSDTNFGSTLCAPTISNASENLHEGTYTVRARVNGCWSEPASVFVSVNARPNNPQAAQAGPFCADEEGIALTVTTSTATPGATYRWYLIENNGTGTEIGSTVSTTFNVPNPEDYPDGTYNFYVITETNGCFSQPSAEIAVAVSTIPNNEAYAGEDLQVCEEDEINLNADAPTVGTGLWTQLPQNPSGAEITNPDEAVTSVAGLVPGNMYNFVWSLSNGACENYSIDTAEITVSLVELADAGSLIEACSVTEINLQATAPTFGTGTWTQPNVQALLGVTIEELNNPTSLVTNLVPGNTYIFTWTIPDNGCGDDSDDVLVQVANDIANAGQDDSVCGFGCVTLAATNPSIGSGAWFSPDPDISFAAPNDPTTEACGLSDGENLLIWILNNGACGEAGIDTVRIDYQTAPMAEDDIYTIPFAGVSELNVVENDIFNGDIFTSLIQEPQNGRVEESSEGVYTYTADINFVGTDFFSYELCIPDCECTEAIVRLSIGGEATCEIPTIITPNGDGINDAFVVPCLAEEEKFPNNTVSIFNQWGDEVFREELYQNNWRGTYDGQELPVGTYFFIVDFGTGEKPQTGFLLINR